MKQELVLVRYGELTTKGKNRKQFLSQLVGDVRRHLKHFPNLKIEAGHDRMVIHLCGEDGFKVIDGLKKIFGLYSFSLAYRVEPTIEAIIEGALELSKNQSFKTFKVITRRHDKLFPMTSDQVNRAVAYPILTTFDTQVDVHHPEMSMMIEIRKHAVYLMNDIVMGAGGYPLRMSGKALLQLSGGIDSPVAGYLAMKRGILLEAIHFASPPYTSDQALHKVEDLCLKLASYSLKIKLHVIPFTKLQEAIYQHVDSSYTMIVMRRMMLRIATKVAKKQELLAIVNGESIGQVASQTLHNMNVINDVTSMPVIRPLATYDKIEIMALARHIQTYDISIQPYEDCCTIFKAKNPTTKAQLNKVVAYEALFDYERLCDECVEQMTSKLIDRDQEWDVF